MGIKEGDGISAIRYYTHNYYLKLICLIKLTPITI